MKGIRLSTLSSATPQEKEKLIMSLIHAAQEPDAASLQQHETDLTSRIRKFEGRYEMSSESMKRCLSNGQIKETADICSWLMLLQLKDELSCKSSPTRTQSVSDLFRDA